MLYGDKIKQERERQGLSRKELAKKADITPYYVYKIEEGKSRPSVDILMRIATALDKDANYFVSGMREEDMRISMRLMEIVRERGLPMMAFKKVSTKMKFLEEKRALLDLLEAFNSNENKGG